jgi:hypothetical protein
MKLSTLTLCFVLITTISCNKKNEVKAPVNNNQLYAAVEGESMHNTVFNEKGPTVRMGCLSTGNFYINASDSYGQMISMQFSTCYPAAGTYSNVKTVFQPTINGRAVVPFTNRMNDDFTVKIDEITIDGDAISVMGSFRGTFSREYEYLDFGIVTETSTVSGSFRGNTFTRKGTF